MPRTQDQDLRDQLFHAQGINDALEDRVEQGTDDLRTAVAELEAFAYSVSHDLRAPLRAISGYSELLIQDMDPGLDENSVLYLNRIHRNCRHMGVLIDDLLEFSRVARKDLTMQHIDVKELVWICIREVTEGTDGVAAEIHVGELPDCHGDWRLMKQVFMNLLSNAIKYSRNSSPPVIKIGGAETSNNEVIYSVQDNGVGFDTNYSDQLFQVFQRLHRAEDYEGTGVGLALCQRIVSRHGGRIWADAQIDAGATFFVALPAGEVS